MSPLDTWSNDSWLNGFDPIEGQIVEGGSPNKRVRCHARFGCNLRDKGPIVLKDKPRLIRRLLAEGNQLQEDATLQWDKRTRSFYLIYTYVQPILEDDDPGFKK